jgi:hypothetical protein
MSHKFHTGKAWRHFVNQLLSRRLPEVPNSNSKIPGKIQSPNRKRSRGLGDHCGAAEANQSAYLRIGEVNSQLEVSKPAPRVVANDQ